MKRQMLVVAVLIALLFPLFGCGKFYMVRVIGNDNIFTAVPSVTAPTGSQAFDGKLSLPIDALLANSHTQAPVTLAAGEKIPDDGNLVDRIMASDLSDDDKAVVLALMKKAMAGKPGTLTPTVVVIKRDNKTFPGTRPGEE